MSSETYYGPARARVHGTKIAGNSHRFVTLDMLRGAAAFAVLLSHARAYAIQSYAEVTEASLDIGLSTKVFYALTSFGHEAVIIFFGLSGFLVGAKALRDLLSCSFSWPHYLLRRITRLWVVLLPALLFTWIFDTLGTAVGAGSGYDGNFASIYNSGPPIDDGIHLSPSALFGNIFFLQTITVPTFGSNSPLWSLANEFWYYILFPLCGWIVMAQVALAQRLFGVAILALLCLALPTSILHLGLIWLAGAFAGLVATEQRLVPALSETKVRLATIGVLFLSLMSTKVPSLGIEDLEFGLIAAACLPVLAHIQIRGRCYHFIARSSSEISYTLYLTHFPLLSLITFSMISPVRFSPDMFGLGVFVALVMISLVWAVFLYWLFERQTDKIYAGLSRFF